MYSFDPSGLSGDYTYALELSGNTLYLRVFLITLICGITTLVPQYFVAIHLGAELPAFAGSLVSLFAVIRVNGALHDHFAQAPGGRDKDNLVETGFGIDGEHYA